MKLTDQEIIIRKITKEDLEALWEVAYQEVDAEWTKWNGPYFEDPHISLQDFLEIEGPKYYMDKEHIQLIEVEGMVSGIMSYHYEDGNMKRWPEIGIILYRNATWGKHIGSRALTLWISYMFDTMPNIEHIGFTTWSKNKRMMKLGDRIGMKLEGRIRKVRYWEGKFWDSIKYGVLREEWK